MHSMTDATLAPPVTIGVDTHKDVHVAIALDHLGIRLGQLQIPATTAGYRHLTSWAASLGPTCMLGVEGTGSYGAALTRHLNAAGYRVIEVNRPDRATRYRHGKSDPVDAEAAARSVLARVSTATPKDTSGVTEMIRMLKIAKDSAVKARTQAINQIKAILITAPAELRETLTGLTRTQLITTCAALPTAALTDPTAAAAHTLNLLARRIQHLTAETRTLTTQLTHLVRQTNPTLLATHGIGPDTAAQLMATAGGNPHRLHHEAAFAALCGVSPIPASSGHTRRWRLNRGGDRQANAALHRIIIVRLRWHQPTRDYMQRRQTEGKTKPEIIRCLKRYLAREIFHLLHPQTTPTHP